MIEESEDGAVNRVRAANERYAVATKPLNPHKTVLYTVVDLVERVRGPEDLIFGMGAETDEGCERMLSRVVSGESGISQRHRIDLWIKKVVRLADVRCPEWIPKRLR